MLSSLQEFISKLENHGELCRISTRVDLHGELAGIVRKISGYPKGGPGLLFEKPGDSRFPLAANLFGSRRRMRTALGVNNLLELSGALAGLLKDQPADTLPRLVASLLACHDINCCAPTTISNAPCRENIITNIDLMTLPFARNWPEDGTASGTGRYITMGQVCTCAPNGNSRNYGIYRCQIHESRTLAIRWRHGSGAELHHRQFIKRKQRMPVAIVLGGPPSLALTSAWPLPDELDELVFAGWLRNSPIPVVECLESQLLVPAEAELVIEGLAEPDQFLTEGPFGNHTGRYNPAGPAARVTVTRVYHRKNPIIPATFVGEPPQEDCWMMLGWERMLAAMLPRLVPGVKEIRIPLAWVFRNSAVISLENPSARMVREAVHTLWQLPWFKKSRLIVLVDAAIPPGDILKVAWRVANEPDWLSDLIQDGTGNRLAIDATKRVPDDRLEDPESQNLITSRWKEYGLP